MSTIEIKAITTEDIDENLRRPIDIADIFAQSTERLLPLINLLNAKYQMLINQDAADQTLEDENLMIDLEAILLSLGCHPEVDRD